MVTNVPLHGVDVDASMDAAIDGDDCLAAALAQPPQESKQQSAAGQDPAVWSLSSAKDAIATGGEFTSLPVCHYTQLSEYSGKSIMRRKECALHAALRSYSYLLSCD